MKKFILAAIVMMVSVSTFAQREAGTVTIQPRIGFSASDFNNTSDTDARVGVVVGAEAEYYLTNHIGLSGGVFYSQQGSEITMPNSTEVKFKLDYINVPLIANFYVWKGLALKTGLQPGFKVNSTISASRGDVKAEAKMGDVKSFDLALPIGVSYDFGHFVLDARYNLGLLKVFDDSQFDSKNFNFQLTLGYKFNL